MLEKPLVAPRQRGKHRRRLGFSVRVPLLSGVLVYGACKVAVRDWIIQPDTRTVDAIIAGSQVARRVQNLRTGGRVGRCQLLPHHHL